MTTGPDPQQPPPDPHRPAGQTPPPGSYPPGQPGYPMVRPLRPDEEKLWAVAAQLGPLLLGFLAPLMVWLVV